MWTRMSTHKSSRPQSDHRVTDHDKSHMSSSHVSMSHVSTSHVASGRSYSSTDIMLKSLNMEPVRELCRLCFDEHTTQHMYTLEQCMCSFCIVCMREYLKVEITQGNVQTITCPDGACVRHGHIESTEIEKIVDSRLYDKYTLLKYQQEVNTDPSRTFCPRPDCDAVVSLRSTSAGQTSNVKATPVKCNKCGMVFCSLCKNTWHESQTCDEHMSVTQKDSTYGIPFVSSEDATIKRCPICRVPIERNDGCAQMMCKQCKHVFCWYCLASLDDDFLLRHYDKGQCKNRLGHSRASVIWHRAQVVGIFAGFGVLLLVASPFLLLAAPCILCCKCKTCHINEEDDPDVLPPSTITWILHPPRLPSTVQSLTGPQTFLKALFMITLLIICVQRLMVLHSDCHWPILWVDKG